MARYTYTGKLTDFSRTPFPPSQVLELVVKPADSGFGGDGLLADAEIPVTVASNGSFSVDLEASGAVIGSRGGTVTYALVAKYLRDGQAVGQSEWARFYAPVGGGNIKDLANMPLPPGAVAYGYGPPPADFRGGFYLDISGTKPVLYVPEGSAL